MFYKKWMLLLVCLVSSVGYAQEVLLDIDQKIQGEAFQEAKAIHEAFKAEAGTLDSAQYLSYLKQGFRIAKGLRSALDMEKTGLDIVEHIGMAKVDAGNLHLEIGEAYYRFHNEAQPFRQHAEKAKGIYKNTVGTQDLRYTRCLNSLGFAHQLNGDYREAEKTLTEAAKIKERAEVQDIQYSRILNQLANVQTRLNKFMEAEVHFKKSLHIKEALKGKDAHYAKTLANYALLLQAIGRYEDALLAIDDVLAICASAAGSHLHDQYRHIKASVLIELGEMGQAISLLEGISRSRKEYEASPSPDYAKILLELSQAHYEERRYDAALAYSAEALQVFETLNGSKHPNYAVCLRKHADNLLAMNRTEGLEKMYKEAAQVMAIKYSRQHLEFFKSEYAYFKFLKKTRQYDKAVKVLDAIDDIITRHIVEASKYMSVKELIEVTYMYHAYFQDMLALTSLNPDNHALTEKAFNSALFYKGYILESMLSLKKAITQSNAITELSQTLGEEKLKMSTELDKENRDQLVIGRIQQRVDEIELEIARALGQLRAEDRQVKWDAIQYELGADEAAVEFLRVKLPDTTGYFYAALVLRQDAGHPVFVPLFAEAAITSHFEGNLRNSAPLVKALYGWDARGLQPTAEAEKISLYHLIWKPLATQMDGISKIYYVADGILHSIALHAIPTDLENVTADRIQWVSMTTLRNLVKSRSSEYQRQKRALLLGGLNYGTLPPANDRGSRSTWAALPWTLKEVDNISAMLQTTGMEVTTLKGDTPVKKTVKQHLLEASPQGNQIIHWATHGYFATEDLLHVKSKIKPLQAGIELSQSGIVLAKANEADPKDAILSAYEIADMNLQGTELVVLSACETALGQVYENEGVYGLQRAFKIAGARYIIMSLWQVPDRETKIFMETFYEHHVKNGMNIPDAFYATQKALKAQLLDPVRWAGFVLLN